MPTILALLLSLLAPPTVGTLNVARWQEMPEQETSLVTATEHTDLLALQEVTAPLRDALPPTWRMYPASVESAHWITPVQIAYDATVWSAVKPHRSIHLGGPDGLAGYASALTVQHNLTGQVVTIISAHLISGAFDRPGQPARHPHRLGHWLGQVSHLNALVRNLTREFRDTPGWRLVVAGDFNRHTLSGLGTLESPDTPPTFDTHSRLDRILSTQALVDFYTVTVPSDHDALIATIGE